MVWGGITYNARTPLIFVEGNLTAARYIAEILEPVVLPFLEANPGVRFFQQDNAGPHSAWLTRDSLDDHEVNVMDWPPYFPDFNPIEHLWDQLKTAIARCRPSPRNKQELITAAQEEWDAAIPQSSIQTLINSMRHRCTACVDADGGHTPF